uniref:Uncharacterized protein n=1 Tax=Caenorhabditis japonica TaxID=281687 RepID=A0A8R1ITK7_CAEJA
MTLNYHAHGKQIEESYRRVSDDSEGDKWVIYDYEGNSNTLRVGEEGREFYFVGYYGPIHLN